MYAQVNGVRLFFDVEGKQYVPDGDIMRKKPVCFILHGGPGSNHYHFLPDFSVLAQDMQLVYIDNRFCGHSGQAPIESCTMEQNAEDAEALRQYLGLDKIFLLGLSYGGMVAQQYALKYQQHLQGLILCSTAPSCRLYDTLPLEMDKRATAEQKRMLDILLNKEDATEADMKEYMVVCGNLYHYKYDKAACEAGAKRSIWSAEVFKFGNKCGLDTFDFVPQLHTITVPTLILAGQEDFITPPVHSQEIADHIKQAEYTAIPEAAHEIGSDRPDITFPLIRDFVYRNAEV